MLQHDLQCCTMSSKHIFSAKWITLLAPLQLLCTNLATEVAEQCQTNDVETDSANIPTGLPDLELPRHKQGANSWSPSAISDSRQMRQVLGADVQGATGVYQGRVDCGFWSRLFGFTVSNYLCVSRLHLTPVAGAALEVETCGRWKGQKSLSHSNNYGLRMRQHLIVFLHGTHVSTNEPYRPSGAIPSYGSRRACMD